MKNPALGAYELERAAKFVRQLNEMQYPPETPVTHLLTEIDPSVRLTVDYDDDEGFMLTDFQIADDVAQS